MEDPEVTENIYTYSHLKISSDVKNKRTVLENHYTFVKLQTRTRFSTEHSN